jgi:hypothetical protein
MGKLILCIIQQGVMYNIFTLPLSIAFSMKQKAVLLLLLIW